MKLLLLDKDGTLAQPRSGEGFIQSPEDQILLPGVAEKLNKAEYNAWTACIISNQEEVEAGHKTLNNAILEMEFAVKLIRNETAMLISEVFFCPDFAGNFCWRGWSHVNFNFKENKFKFEFDWNSLSPFAPYTGLYRKPNPGMLQVAIDHYQPTEILFVGDRPEDQQAATAAGIPFQWAKNKNWISSDM